MLSGVLLGLHWITYFYSLSVAGVAVGVLSLFTYPLLIAVLEPLVFKTPLQVRHLFFALLALVGVYVMVPSFDLANESLQGVLWGVVSALCFAIRNLLMKKHIVGYPGTTLMFYQLVVIVLTFWPVFLVWDAAPLQTDWPWLLVLGLITTAAGHTLFVMSFRHFTVSTVGILSSLQPIFGILLGWVFLSEVPPRNAILGGSIILVVAVIEAVLAGMRRA